MFRIFDYQASQPRRKVNNNNPIAIPHTPNERVLATIHIEAPFMNEHHNRVQLMATVGVRGQSGTSQLLFRILRNGREIFNTLEGVESDSTSEADYNVTFQAIDNLCAGCNEYELTIENIASGTEAAVIGPISLSGLGITHPC